MEIYYALDLFGTAVFAYTGANAGKRHNFHFIGVLYIAALSAIGGGTIRTVLVQAPTLFWMSSPDYMLVVLTVVLYSYLPAWQLNTQKYYFYVLDSFALAVFVSLGFTVTLADGQPTHIAFAMGILSGIGGGIIRDAITNQPPQALSDPFYPFMIIVSSVSCLVSESLGLAGWTIAVPAVMTVIFGTHIYYRFNSKKHYKPPAALEFAGQINPSFYKSAQSMSYVGLKALMVLCLLGSTGYFFNVNQLGSAMPNKRLHGFYANHESIAHNISLKPELSIPGLSMPSIEENIHPTLPAFLLKSELNPEPLAKPAIRTENRPDPKIAKFQNGVPDKVEPAIQAVNYANSPSIEKIDIATVELKENLPPVQQVAFTVTSKRMEHLATVANAPLTIATKEHRFKAERTSLSADELQYAREQFKALATAIKQKNINAVEMLTAGGDGKTEICTILFDKYVEINAGIDDFKNIENSKIVTATLQLKNLRLPNGDLTLPADSYGRIALNLEHSRNGWSKIRW